ncbi:MAG: hypothetical protein ACWGO1_13095 [Anaerolineales bacterium]
MPSEYEIALRNAASSVAKYVQDAASMLVETKYVEIGEAGDVDFESAKPVARTEIKLDGDSQAVLPMRRNETGALEVDITLFDLHQQNVATAIEYRSSILNALLGTLVSQRRSG